MGSEPSKDDVSNRESVGESKCCICNNSVSGDFMAPHNSCPTRYHVVCWITRASMGKSIKCDTCGYVIGNPLTEAAELFTSSGTSNQFRETSNVVSSTSENSDQAAGTFTSSGTLKHSRITPSDRPSPSGISDQAAGTPATPEYFNQSQRMPNDGPSLSNNFNRSHWNGSSPNAQNCPPNIPYPSPNIANNSFSPYDPVSQYQGGQHLLYQNNMQYQNHMQYQSNMQYHPGNQNQPHFGSSNPPNHPSYNKVPLLSNPPPYITNPPSYNNPQPFPHYNNHPCFPPQPFGPPPRFHLNNPDVPVHPSPTDRPYVWPRPQQFSGEINNTKTHSMTEFYPVEQATSVSSSENNPRGRGGTHYRGSHPGRGETRFRGSHSERGGASFRGSHPERGGASFRGSYCDRGRPPFHGSHPERGGAQSHGSYPDRGRTPNRGSHPDRGRTPFRASHPGRGGAQFRGRFKRRIGGSVVQHSNSSDENEDSDDTSSVGSYPEEFGFLIETYKSNYENGLIHIPESVMEKKVTGFVLVSPGIPPFSPKNLKDIFQFLIEYPDAKPINLSNE